MLPAGKFKVLTVQLAAPWEHKSGSQDSEGRYYETCDWPLQAPAEGSVRSLPGVGVSGFTERHPRTGPLVISSMGPLEPD